MVPVTELRGAIPIGIAMGLNPFGVYILSVIGSTLVSIPLVLTFRQIMEFLKRKKLFVKIVEKIDRKIDSSMKKLKSATIIGIIIFVGIPLPTTGTWTASAIASNTQNEDKGCIIWCFCRKCSSWNYCFCYFFTFNIK